MRCSPTLLALVATAFTATSAHAAVTRILPLGDSITQADANHHSYRRELFRQLQAAGYAVDFVGGQNAPHNATQYPNTDFDLDHEGHWGWRVDQVLAQIGSWATASPHDIVLLHLGSNDLLQQQSIASTISELGQLIDRLRQANPSVSILLAQIIPHAVSDGTPVGALNTAIANLAAAKNTASSRVILVDHSQDFNATTDTYDGIHPNTAGEQKMANAWFSALQPVLNSLANTSTRKPYGGTPRSLPGTIQVVDYDEGGEGLAYHDSSPGNSGASYRNDNVDISYDNLIPSAGWTVGGEWLEYSVTITPGIYDLNLEASSATAGGDLEVLLNGTSLGMVRVTQTGSWATFRPFSLRDIAISTTGPAVMRLRMHGSKDMYDLRAITFVKVGNNEPAPPAQQPYGGVAQTIPGTITIPNYDQGGEGIAYHDSSSGNSGNAYRSDDVDISIKENVPSVGWTAGGEWLEYTVDVTPGTYDLQLEASSATAGGNLEMILDGQSLGAISVHTTGSWTTFRTFSLANIAITRSGRHVLRLNLLGNKDMSDLRSLRFIANASPNPEPEPEPQPENPQQPYAGVLQNIPGLIRIPDYDIGGEGVAYHDTTPGNAGKVYRNDGVDLSSDAGAVSVGWTAPGEWLEYTVQVRAGTYDLRLLAASEGGGTVQVSLDGKHLGNIAVSNTGSWSIFRHFDLNSVTIAKTGPQVLRLTMSGSGSLFDLRSLECVDRSALGDPGYGAGDPVRVNIDWNTVERKGYRGDNWCMTHAADGNLYTMMDDGHGFFQVPVEWNSRLIRISGGPDFRASDTQNTPGWPFMKAVTRFYGYGTYAVGKRIYTWLWMSEKSGYNRPVANRLIYTDDYGKTFYRWDGTLLTEANLADTSADSFFFYKEQGRPKDGKTAYAFNWIAFCQNGQANTAADAQGDPYVYMYAGEQYDVTKLAMIRVHKDQVTTKSAYQYLKSVDANGAATWTNDPGQRGVTHTFPQTNYNGEKWIWASWQPSVVYNKDLKRYLMVSYGISDPGASYWSGWCNANSENSATVVMLHAKHPWGPWTEFYRDYEWKTPQPVPASYGFNADSSRTYQFKLNPKWIENNGRTMYLHWSDAGGNWTNGNHGHDKYWYRWNQVRIDLDIAPDNPAVGGAQKDGAQAPLGNG